MKREIARMLIIKASLLASALMLLESCTGYLTSQFQSAAIAVIMNLTNRASYVGQQRRKNEQWPTRCRNGPCSERAVKVAVPR